MAIRGGCIEVGMAQARVVTFGFAELPWHETRTVCIGCNSRMDWLMFTGVFADKINHYLHTSYCWAYSYFSFLHLNINYQFNTHLGCIRNSETAKKESMFDLFFNTCLGVNTYS